MVHGERKQLSRTARNSCANLDNQWQCFGEACLMACCQTAKQSDVASYENAQRMQHPQFVSTKATPTRLDLEEESVAATPTCDGQQTPRANQTRSKINKMGIHIHVIHAIAFVEHILALPCTCSLFLQTSIDQGMVPRERILGIH